ncbi:MAG: rod shape-determining protein [Geobacteraceae bacterium]
MKIWLRNSSWKPDIAIDLGTAMTRVSSSTRNLYMVPSVVRGQSVMSSGVIKDLNIAVELLGPLLFKARKFGIVRPNVVICAPSDTSFAELHRLRECISKAGATIGCIVPAPLAAAIGAGMDVSSPYAGMIMDIGEGITDCAVIKSGKIIKQQVARAGCYDLRKHFINLMATYSISISGSEAERIVREVGVCREVQPNQYIAICGRSATNMMPRTSFIFKSKIQEHLEPIIVEILYVAQIMMEEISPDIGCEIIENGIFLSGGGALLKGMQVRLEEITHISVTVAPKPLEAVVSGAREMLPIVSLLNRK